MKLLAISNPAFFPDEAVLINSLFREGLECLHIRKPACSEDELSALVNEISPEFRERISTHQHHHLAKELEIKRLHFTSRERNSTSLERLKLLTENRFTLSTSIHDLNELDRIPAYFQYTFFGPVFDSISKSGYKSTLQKDFFLKEDLKKIPIIALGGIEADNLEKVRKMNFGGAAVLGALWKNPGKAVEVFSELSSMIVQARSG